MIDISPMLSPNLAVFPGDTPLTRKVLLDFDQGHQLSLSTLNATVHLGAHADAPSHYGAGAANIESRDLSFYFGLCEVVTVTEAGQQGRIGLPEWRRARSAAKLSDRPSAERVLFRTLTYKPNQWSDDFFSLDAELIKWLADSGVRTVGIDTPSVDPAQSKALETHAAILHHDLAILEGLVLNQVNDGLYDLIALPLKLEGFEASPVRAVLVPAGTFTAVKGVQT